MSWQGIKADTTDVDETQGASSYQLNTRMQVDGELQRRYGMLSTGLPPLDGPVLYLASASGFVVRGTATNVEGDPDVTGIEVGPERRPPIIDVIRRGTGWTLFRSAAISIDSGWMGGDIAYGSCSGEVIMTVSTIVGGSVTVTVNRGGFGTIYTRTYAPGQSGSDIVPVPWTDEINGGIYAYFTYNGAGPGGIDYTVVGQSTPGCAI
jgi:hypothetical protein